MTKRSMKTEAKGYLQVMMMSNEPTYLLKVAHFVSQATGDFRGRGQMHIVVYGSKNEEYHNNE